MVGEECYSGFCLHQELGQQEFSKRFSSTPDLHSGRGEKVAGLRE